MNEFDSMVSRQRKWMIYILALLVLGVGLLPYTRIFKSLLLGGVVSFFNLWLLQCKTKAITHAAATKSGTRKSLGTLTRMISAVFAAYIAMRYEEHFHIIAVVIGLMLSYIVIFLDRSIYFLSNKDENGK